MRNDILVLQDEEKEQAQGSDELLNELNEAKKRFVNSKFSDLILYSVVLNVSFMQACTLSFRV